MTALIDLLTKEKNLICEIETLEDLSRFYYDRINSRVCHEPISYYDKEVIKDCTDAIDNVSHKIEIKSRALKSCRTDIKAYFSEIM